MGRVRGIVLATLIGAAMFVPATSTGAAKPVKTYGIQDVDGKQTAVFKPQRYKIKDVFRQITVDDIGTWDGWGELNAVADAGSIETCDATGTTCTPSSGTISFSDTIERKCKVKKGKPKKKVLLYGGVLVQPEEGGGGGTSFGTDGDPPPCPKF